MSQVKKNVVANYIGQGWRLVMSLAFVPLYIKYLGIESYGLIGIFAMLQAWLSLLDMGMRPALSREMARFTGGAHTSQSIWNLLRSIEVIVVVIGVSVAIGIWVVSGWLASDWVQAKSLPVDVVTNAFILMGIVIALQFIESIYTSSIAGLQKQVLQNVVISLMATIRGVGAVAILIWVSPTISAFFIWQGLVSLATAMLLAYVVYSLLPSISSPARFSMSALISIWRYSLGMLGITVLAILLTQIDKVLLSKLLTLETFGYYALAGVVASTLPMLALPIAAAFYPRFTELLAKGNDVDLRRTYHQAAQLVTVLMGSAAVILIVFADRLLLLWTADPVLTQQVALLVSVLVAGNLLNGLMWIPYYMQLAHGWTSLSIKINMIAVAVLIPAIFLVAQKYGAIGAAWVWVALNAGYVLIGVHFMYHRILRCEKWGWYLFDVSLPLASAGLASLLCWWVIPEQLGRIGEFFVLAGSSIAVFFAASLSAPLVRQLMFGYYNILFNRLRGGKV